MKLELAEFEIGEHCTQHSRTQFPESEDRDLDVKLSQGALLCLELWLKQPR